MWTYLLVAAKVGFVYYVLISFSTDAWTSEAVENIRNGMNPSQMKIGSWVQAAWLYGLPAGLLWWDWRVGLGVWVVMGLELVAACIRAQDRAAITALSAPTHSPSEQSSEHGTGAVDPKALIESRIEVFKVSYEMNKRRHPERDPNAWLAECVKIRGPWKNQNDDFYYYVTAQQSVCDDPASASALYVLYKEHPELETVIEPIYTSLIRPEHIDRESLAALWRKTNPWTAEHFPFVAMGIAAATQGEVSIPGAAVAQPARR